MKINKLSLMAAFSLVAALAQAQQAKTITVDNKIGAAAMFASVQEACNAANAGDTILIAGSPDAYGSVTLTKKLHLIGPGYFLAENGIPGINKFPATINDRIILRNVELSSPSGSTLTGISGGYFIVEAGVQDVLIDKCIGIPGVGGHVNIKRSWMHDANFGAAAPNCTIENSVIGTQLVLSVGSTARNCVLHHGVMGGPLGSSVSSMIFILNQDQISGNYRGNFLGSITHSMEVGPLGTGNRPSTLPPGAGNFDHIFYLSEVFEVGEARDKYYKLASNSPAKGSGLGGSDLGLFGGPQPYVISGIPSLPRVTRFLVPATATDSSGLRFELEATAF